jgi:Family of unknown function (DUF6328)
MTGGMGAADLTSADPSRTDDEQERLNREMAELLQELRVAVAGVQVLFGFLLAVPFQQRFETVSSFQRGVYSVTLIAAAVATALLIAPSAYHRILFRQGMKPSIIRIGTAQLLGGLASLAVAMSGAVLLVTDFLFGSSTATVVVVLVASLYVALWFVLGLVQRVRA